MKSEYPNRRVFRRPLFFLVLALGLLAGGCSAQAPPLDARAGFVVTQFTGAPLSGPTTRIADWSDPGAGIFVRADLYAVELTTVSGMLPLVSQSRLIVRAPTDQPLLATADITSGFRWAQGSAAEEVSKDFAAGKLGPSSEVGHCAVAIPPGATAALAVFNPNLQPQPGSPTGVKILLHCPKAMQLEPAIAAAGTIQYASGDSAQPQVGAELSVLSAINLEKPATAAIFMPFGFADVRLKGLLVLIRASQGTPEHPEYAAAATQSAGDLAESAQAATVASQQSLTDLTYWSTLQVGMAGISDPSRRRASLSYLAARTGATICEDFALVAGDENLAQMTATVLPRLSAAHAAGNVPAARWALDSSALALMVKLQNDSKLPPALLSVLIRSTGEAAVDEGTLDEALGDSHDSKDFEVRITAENFNYLEDNSPAARARAYDWLAAHNAAPAGYDPLGSRDDRQAALEKAYDALSASNGATP
jgi:hypothetical protein